MKAQREPNLSLPDFKNFDLETLTINSQILKKNPLKDPYFRHNPVLVPKGEQKPYPVVFVLAGYSGNGLKYFSQKTFEHNMPEVIDQCVTHGEGAKAIYIFVDAMTYWGGSQFINSKGMGNYENYIIKELVPAVKEHFLVKEGARHWCVTGGSSGGYGALHLASMYPQIFGLAAAIAPDSFFEMSLLPEIYQALPSLERFGGIKGIKKEMQEGRFLNRREAHTVLNAVAMSLCYSPHPTRKNHIQLPVDPKTGKMVPQIWNNYKKYDPIEFLKVRKKNLKHLRRVYLDVGNRDQYHLQFGARQIRELLKASNVSLDYSEFNGNHFDISLRRPQVWSWLKKQWS